MTSICFSFCLLCFGYFAMKGIYVYNFKVILNFKRCPCLPSNHICWGSNEPTSWRDLRNHPNHTRRTPFFGEGISILPRTRRALAASELLFNSFSIMWSLGSILFKKDQLEKKQSDILLLKPGKLQCSGNHGKLQIVFVGWKKIHVAQTFKTQMLPALRIMGSQN